jgi:hypothetical protein
MDHIEASIAINAPICAGVRDSTQAGWFWTASRSTARWASARVIVLSCDAVLTDHVNRVFVYEPPWHLVLRSEAHPDLEIQLTVSTAPGGARLAHAESFTKLLAVSGSPEQADCSWPCCTNG